MSNPYYAGVDGGGTKTTVVLVDIHGAEAGRIQTGASNPAVIGFEASGAVLRDAMARALANLDTHATIAAAWFGLAGCDRPGDQEALLPHLRGLANSVRLTNDSELALGALPGSTGVVLVSGTGSIAFARAPTGERFRAGGWGAIMGDEGSGYELGRNLLKAFAAEVDGRGPATSMTSALCSRWGLSDPFQAIPRVYSPPMSKGEIADLARIVVSEAAAGDKLASSLLDSAADELAILASTVGNHLNTPDRLEIAVTGSLLVNVAAFRYRVVHRLEAIWPIVNVHVAGDPAGIAARYMVKHMKG